MFKSIPIFCGFGTSSEHFLSTEIKRIFNKYRLKPLFINALDRPLFQINDAKTFRGLYPVVLVHSQGLAHFLRSSIRCKHLVVLNSFCNFCSTENNALEINRLSLRQLQRMQYQFKKNPVEVIQNFQKQAAYGFISSRNQLLPAYKLKELDWQLKALEKPINTESLKQKVLEKCTFVLAKNDPIVPEYRSKQLVEEVQKTKPCSIYRLDEEVHFSTSPHFNEIFRAILT